MYVFKTLRLALLCGKYLYFSMLMLKNTRYYCRMTEFYEALLLTNIPFIFDILTRKIVSYKQFYAGIEILLPGKRRYFCFFFRKEDEFPMHALYAPMLRRSKYFCQSNIQTNNYRDWINIKYVSVIDLRSLLTISKNSTCAQTFFFE